jgi:hypothetical protein
VHLRAADELGQRHVGIGGAELVLDGYGVDAVEVREERRGEREDGTEGALNADHRAGGAVPAGLVPQRRGDDLQRLRRRPEAETGGEEGGEPPLDLRGVDDRFLLVRGRCLGGGHGVLEVMPVGHALKMVAYLV